MAAGVLNTGQNRPGQTARINRCRPGSACYEYSTWIETTIGLTIAGAMTPAGLGGCVIEMMDRGLVDFVISTGANLYHDLHYALNFTLHRGSPFANDVELYEDGVIRIYDVLFPATVLLPVDCENVDPCRFAIGCRAQEYLQCQGAFVVPRHQMRVFIGCRKD